MLAWTQRSPKNLAGWLPDLDRAFVRPEGNKNGSSCIVKKVGGKRTYSGVELPRARCKTGVVGREKLALRHETIGAEEAQDVCRRPLKAVTDLLPLSLEDPARAALK